MITWCGCGLAADAVWEPIRTTAMAAYAAIAFAHLCDSSLLIFELHVGTCLCDELVCLDIPLSTGAVQCRIAIVILQSNNGLTLSHAIEWCTR